MEEVKSMPCKRCFKCGEVKDLSEFYKCSKRCKECCKKASREADQFAKDSTEKGVIRVLYKTQRPPRTILYKKKMNFVSGCMTTAIKNFTMLGYRVGMTSGRNLHVTE